MNVKNQRVIHKILGNGVVISQDDKYITVEFSSKKSKFLYPNPETFEKYLVAADPAIHAAIIRETEEQKAIAEIACKQAEEEKRKSKEAALATEQARRETEFASRKSNTRPSSMKPTLPKYSRVHGKSVTFFVFQGDTFDIESRGGFIWAPQHSQSGSRVFHWDNMLLVKEGDIVLHGYNGYVMAVSMAISNCYDSERPKERAFEDSWNNEGRRVDLKYTIFSAPIKTSDFRYDILEHCKAKYSPFDKDGNGNMGYLYELDHELACIFLRAATRNNSYLADIDYIKTLTEETE